MLKIERAERTITVISDDANSENAILADAVEHAAPELLDAFNNTEFANGELRWEVDEKDGLSLLDVIDATSHDPAMDPSTADEIYEQLDAICREAGLYDKTA